MSARLGFGQFGIVGSTVAVAFVLGKALVVVFNRVLPVTVIESEFEQLVVFLQVKAYVPGSVIRQLRTCWWPLNTLAGN